MKFHLVVLNGMKKQNKRKKQKLVAKMAAKKFEISMNKKTKSQKQNINN